MIDNSLSGIELVFYNEYTNFIHRKGSGVLYNELLHGSDFFYAPASSKYHLAKEGGLVEHSLNVYKNLFNLIDVLDEWACFSEESVAIVSLLHDVCKIGMYTPTFRNAKSYDEKDVTNAPSYMVKEDGNGQYVWVTVPGYDINEKFIYGHGEKSVYLITKYMELSDEEAQAIRFHMASWVENDKSMAGKVFAENKLAWLLHVADEMATYWDES